MMWPLILTLVALAGVLIAARAVLLVVTVQGGSMEPTLHGGDRVLVVRSRRFALVRRGAVVVCRAPDGLVLPGLPPITRTNSALLVKRVAAVAGEPQPTGGVVPAGQVYVTGDAGAGLDSGEFGPIPRTSVVGLVVARLGTSSG